MNAGAWTISIIAIGLALGLAARPELASRRKRTTSGATKTSGAANALADATGESSGRSLEFMSSAWIAMARREIIGALTGRDLGDTRFTLSEEFTDAPTHLRHGNDTIGFSVRIINGTLEVDDHPDPDADLRVISKYSDALRIARDPAAASADPTEASQRMSEGRLRIEGDPSRMPVELQGLDIHALLAQYTS